jgi:integrase
MATGDPGRGLQVTAQRLDGIPERPEISWPRNLSNYDRTPQFLRQERRIIKVAVEMRARRNPHWLKQNHDALARLFRPVDELLDYEGTRGTVARVGVKANLICGMHEQRSVYWSWKEDEWLRFLGTTYREFEGRYGQTECRNYAIAFGYIVGNFASLHRLGPISSNTLCRLIFGNHAVDSAVERCRQELQRIGYADSLSIKRIPSTVCKAMLACRSPILEDITNAHLLWMRENYRVRITQEDLVPLSRILKSLGIIVQALEPRIGCRKPDQDASIGVPPEWKKWVDRWRTTTTLEPGSYRGLTYCLLKVGRWINQQRPDLAQPSAWTYGTASDYVAALMRANVGDWSVVNRALKNRLGKPLAPRSIAQSLSAMRSFFGDCQEWGWIKRQFDPRRAFRTPRSIIAKIRINPRVIQDDIWAKLLWAGLNLTEGDLPKMPQRTSSTKISFFYPCELVRAVAISWLFGGLRNDELVRLRVGCIRWQREDVTIPGTIDVLPKDAVCWLDVPVNKTQPQFTKPVDRPIGDAIAIWEAARPKQPPARDRKTAELVDFLFSYRTKRIGRFYINQRLIPMLCRKANVPEKDARGSLTSHRARSTIASQLFNSKEPLTLFELQEWLGHRDPASTQAYAKVSPTKLAKKYSEAGYFERNMRTVEVLLDRDAIVSGAAARDEPWRYYDLGHGFCTNAYFVQCPHRMACAKCSFYVPKVSARGQLIEGRENLELMLQRIPLTDEERTAVEEGSVLFEQMCQRLADVPTPAGPTPKQISAGLVEISTTSVNPNKNSRKKR